MKIPLSSLAVLACALLPLHAQEAATTAARIDGPIPDGTPPPPEAPKPKFSVRARNILKSETHRQGGRKITIQQISPIDLPVQEKAAAAPPAIEDPAIREHLEELRRNRRPTEQTLFIGTSVLRFPDGTARTLVRLWPEGQGDPVVFWSSADFSLLSGMSSFIGSDNVPRSYLMAWSSEAVANPHDQKLLQNYNLSQLPALPAGKPTFAILSGTPSPETLVAIQSIHDLIANDQPRLQAAYNGRERARLRNEAKLKANPPKPKDLVLNHWTIRPTAEALTQGGTAR
jgi:hypothetical protein